MAGKQKRIIRWPNLVNVSLSDEMLSFVDSLNPDLDYSRSGVIRKMITFCKENKESFSDRFSLLK